MRKVPQTSEPDPNFVFFPEKTRWRLNLLSGEQAMAYYGDYQQLLLKTSTDEVVAGYKTNDRQAFRKALQKELPEALAKPGYGFEQGPKVLAQALKVMRKDALGRERGSRG